MSTGRRARRCAPRPRDVRPRHGRGVRAGFSSSRPELHDDRSRLAGGAVSNAAQIVPHGVTGHDGEQRLGQGAHDGALVERLVTMPWCGPAGAAPRCGPAGLNPATPRRCQAAQGEARARGW